MEQMTEELSGYREELAALRERLAADPSDEDLAQRETDLLEAIALTEDLVGKPEEAMATVGWERAAIDSARNQGADVYITVVDTKAAGWRTGEIDMGGIEQLVMRDVQDASSALSISLAEAGIQADKLPGLLAQLDQLAPGAARPDHLVPFADVLDRTYSLNSLYSGAGFTVSDQALAGRTGNVGAREVKVSGEDLTLDPAGRDVWWFSLKIGSLTPSSKPPSP